jgi:hypothetical protein
MKQLIGEGKEKVEVCCKILLHPEILQSLYSIIGHAKFCVECIDRKETFDQARNIINTYTN